MKNSSSPLHPSVKTVRWIARVLSVMIILLFLFIFMGESVFSGTPIWAKSISALTIVTLVLTAIQVSGLVVAWKWELAGGIMTLVATVPLGINARAVLSPWGLVPFLAILFIVCWWFSRERTT